MAQYHYIGTLHNRIYVEFTGPDAVRRDVSFNTAQLKRYHNDNQLRSAIDQFTEVNYGYTLADYWVHFNADGTISFAVAVNEPVWYEDQPPIPEADL